MKNKKRAGFSVIEIVLVLGVIGILSSFIAPKVRDYLAIAKDSKAINTLQSLRIANETYYLENGNYPNSKDNTIGDVLVELSKYVGDKFELIENELLIDIGGSKESTNTKEIKYGGKVKVDLNSSKEFILVSYGETFDFNIRGDEWSKL